MGGGVRVLARKAYLSQLPVAGLVVPPNRCSLWPVKSRDFRELLQDSQSMGALPWRELGPSVKVRTEFEKWMKTILEDSEFTQPFLQGLKEAIAEERGGFLTCVLPIRGSWS